MVAEGVVCSIWGGRGGDGAKERERGKGDDILLSPGRTCKRPIYTYREREKKREREVVSLSLSLHCSLY